ncbi:coiled-coil domain-containing protein 18-like [Macrobrachium rosenbergii]|uniref:coiled-coil domain-containing protein 18-like n=1 Tax=Macrobrachium rosenbergii TaxID=79674 RepID=UPI0034D5022B
MVYRRIFHLLHHLCSSEVLSMMYPKSIVSSLLTVWVTSCVAFKGEPALETFTSKGPQPLKDSIVSIGSQLYNTASLSSSSPSIKDRIVNIGMSSIAASHVTEDSPFCKKENFSLVCDYTHFSEVIHLHNASAEIASITIKGGRELRLRDNICVNISLILANNVQLQPGFKELCEKDVSFELVTSAIDQLPANVNYVTIKDSELASLNANSNLKSVIFVSSRIRSVSISKAHSKLQSIVLFNTSVDNFQILHLSGNYLFKKDSDINITDRNCFLLTKRDKANVNTQFYPVNSSFMLQDTNVGTSTPDSEDSTVVKIQKENNNQICSESNSYFIGFIVCLILLLILICMTLPYVTYLRKMIHHIDRQLSNPDLYDYRKDNSFLKEQLIYQEHEVSHEIQAEKTQSLLEKQRDQFQHILETVEETSEKLTSVLKAETMKHQHDGSQITSNCERELGKLMQMWHQKKVEFEKSKIIEMENLELQYEEEFNNPTMLFWDRIKDVLEKTKTLNKELIEERYAHWLFAERLNDDLPKLQERADKVLLNKDFITKITAAIKDYLNNWPRILNLAREIIAMPSSGENLFSLLGSLLTLHQSVLEQNFDRQISDQDDKYLSDIEKQKSEMSRTHSILESSINEEKEHMLKQMSKDLESKLTWTKKYVDEVENLYSIRSQLLDAKLEFELKKAERKHSEPQVKLLHLDVILTIQKNYMKSLENMIHISVESLNACVKTVFLGLDDVDNNEQMPSPVLSLLHGKPIIRKQKIRSLFEDRYAQA